MDLQQIATEQAICFGSSRNLVGIVTMPSGKTARSPIGMILLGAGRLHRIGPNRIYVDLARTVANRSVPVLRFDFSGIGDSGTRKDGIPFEEYSVLETQEAMSQLGVSAGVDRFILVGLCSGADAAARTAARDRRVVGLVLANGTLMRETDLEGLGMYATARSNLRYYWKRMFNPKSWLRVITGQSRLRVMRQTLATLLLHRRRKSSELGQRVATECRVLLERGLELFLIYAEGSTNWDIFEMEIMDAIADLRDSNRFRLGCVKGADHVFTPLHSQRSLVRMLEEWLDQKLGSLCERRAPSVDAPGAGKGVADS